MSSYSDATVAHRYDYETVAAAQADQVMGATGAKGDQIHTIIASVATTSSSVQIKDGDGSAITVLPASVAGGIGSYTIILDVVSKAGPWKITTGTGVSCIVTGQFTD